jgi:hypothetical protein
MSYVPEQPHIYQGKQVIINSDRLLFNAKTDSILLFSDKAIGFSTNGSFHFDTGGLDGNKFVVNAPDIYLGLDADKYPTEPALLGDKTEDYLNDLLDMIEGLINVLVGQYTLTAPIVGPCAPFPGNEGNFGTIRTQISDLRSTIEDIKSKRIKLV